MQRALAPLALAALLAYAPAPAGAGPLAPGRASDLVTVIIQENTVCPIAGVAFDRRVLSDGSVVPFEIPAKRVLVITGLDFVATGPAVGGATGTVVVSQQPAGALLVSPLLQGEGVTDAGGTYAGTVTAEPGIAVRPGAPLCLAGPGTPAGILRGFFAKDK